MRRITRIVLTAGVTLGLALTTTPALASDTGHRFTGAPTHHHHHDDHHFGIGHKVG